MSESSSSFGGESPRGAPLTTKLHVPPARADRVPRPHLTERLNAGLTAQSGGFTRKLTLICAPAGFGKTTLAAEWLSKADEPVAWLSLDEGDNDPVRFFTYLVAALQSVDPTIGRAAQAMLRSPQPPPQQALISTLINDLAASPGSCILVLDDYHLIHTLPIHQLLTFLLEHQPPSLHLTIVSREDPPMPLSRLRAQGHVAEIRQDDLRFRADEADHLLRHIMRLQLSASDVAALHERTEGWIAGLQLAALSLRGRDDVPEFVDSFTGSHRFVLDFLMEEVFQRQPPDVRDFLLRTSILDRLTAPLCDAVAGRDDSFELLLNLDHANLFVVPQDESRQWYRYHRLFADLLRHRLERVETRDAVARLHGEASRWYEQEGHQSDAIRHALAGSEWQRAGSLILRAADAMLRRGEVATLLEWCRALPEEELRGHLELYVAFGWALILTSELEPAESVLAEAARLARETLDPEEEATVLLDITSAQAFVARTRGDDARTIELSRRALSLLPPEELAGRSVVAVNLGIAHWSSGQLAEAEQALREAEEAAAQSRNHYARLTAIAFLGAVRGAQGRLHEAAEWLRQAIRVGAGSPPAALAHDTLGALLYEWNDLEAAAKQLERGVEPVGRSGNVEIRIGGCRIRARLRQARGDEGGALEALEEAHALAREHDVSPLMCARNAACHAQIALAQGNLQTAMRWAERVTMDADGCRFYPLLGLTPARLLLAQGEKDTAAEELEHWHTVAAGAGWQFGAIEVRALQALAAPTTHEALTFLAAALALAEAEGYVRTFVDKGEPMAELLRQAVGRGLRPKYAVRLLEAFSRPAPPPRLATQPLIEPLSERELEALALLADYLTYQEIAQALFISVNTVKTHLKNVYGKLGVHGRREAVDRAKELGLLP